MPTKPALGWLTCLTALAGCIASPEPARDPSHSPAPPQDPGVEQRPGLFNHLLIVDVESNDQGDGAPGVDVCLVIAHHCADARTANLVLGGGEPCREAAPGCLTDRTDPQAALSLPDHCRFENVPSDFVSLGTNGMIAIGFEAEIAGCAVTVVTATAGRDRERWRAYLCDSPDPREAMCLNGGTPVMNGEGGDQTFQMPSNASRQGPFMNE
jgi:hypothetical protein